MEKETIKVKWADIHLGKFEFYRKLKGGKWYLHEFTKDAEQLTFNKGSRFWTRYGYMNRYTKVILEETY